MVHLNYNHLHYFWVVAREGSIARASDVLHVTPQTISGQLRTLEESVGNKLFRKAGRGLALTETGQLVFDYADEMFRIGAELGSVLRDAEPTGPMTFRVGVTDVVPKLVAYRLIEPALKLPEPVRMVCTEGKLAELMADLAVHRLDLIIADSPILPNLSVRAYSHSLGESSLSFFAAEAQADTYRDDFPRSLNQAPFLAPTELSMTRRALDQWLEREKIAPRIVCEFDDSALMKAFGQAGIGVFTAPTAIEQEVRHQYGVAVIGRAPDIRGRFYAISAERKLKHPAVLAISEAARRELFGKGD